MFIEVYPLILRKHCAKQHARCFFIEDEMKETSVYPTSYRRVNRGLLFLCFFRLRWCLFLHNMYRQKSTHKLEKNKTGSGRAPIHPANSHLQRTRQERSNLEKATEKKAVVRVDKTHMTGNKILETLPARPRSSSKGSSTVP